MASAAQLIKRQVQLATLRSPSEGIWRECLNFTFPARAAGLQGESTDAQAVQDRKSRMCDGTGTDAGRILAAGIVSGVTPANSLWFQLYVEGASSEEKRWLEAATKITFNAIHGANFDSAGLECALDIVGAGWFVLYIDWNKTRRQLSFEQWPLAECYVAASLPGGLIDTVFRPFQLSAAACVAEYGAECSEATQKLALEKPDDKVELLRAVYPRSKADGYVEGSTISTHMKFASCHVEVKQSKLLRERGYNECPVVVPRWAKLPNSDYATGPASDALPDMRTLNQLTADELSNADVTIAGMWIAEDDGVLNARAIKIGPKKVIVANSVNSMKALEPSGNWQYSEALAQRLESKIRKIFMADQLQPQEGPQMTATEVRVRVALIRQLLGPVYGRLQSEYLAPMIERCYGLLMRNGMFPPVPDTLANRDYAVRYTSPMARAQRAEDVSAMDQFETALLQESELVPEILDTYKWDMASAERAELLGVPAKLIPSEAEIKAIREARTAAQQQQAAAAAMQTGAESFAQAKGQQLAVH